MKLLTAEQLEIQKAAREFVAKNIIPHAAEYDRTGEFPPFLVEAAQAGKYFAMAIPKKYGGLEYDSVTQAVVCEEWGYGCAGMATTLGATMLGTDPVLIAGNEDQKKRFFGAIVNGAIAAFGLTEPGVGSDAGGLKTTAVRSGDEYILNGNKCFITNGAYARVFVICAKTDPSKGLKGISAFIVEKDRPGFTVGGAEHKLGIRSSNTVELHLQDVRIPASNLLGREGDGMKIAMMTLDVARPPIAAAAVGIARRALDECVLHLQRRITDKVQPSQSLQFKLADMATQVEAGRQLLYYAMRLRDTSNSFAKESAITKTFGGDVAMEVTSQAVSMMGSYGYSSILGKLMRDAKIMQIYEGTNQIQRLVIARAVMSEAPTNLGQKVA